MTTPHPLDKLSIYELLDRLFGIMLPRTRLNLHEAAKYGNEDAVRQAIDSGAELDEIDEQGRSALQLAAASGSSEVFAILVEAGATPGDPLVPPVSVADILFLLFRVAGYSLEGFMLAWLLSKLYLPVPLFILQNIKIRIFSLFVTAIATHALSALLLSWSYPSIYSNTRSIIMAVSAFKGDTEYMSTLFFDAAPMLETQEMLLLWSHAVERGYTGICQRLLRIGFPADVLFCHTKYPDIITALLHASGAGHRELVLLLLSNGADPTLLDSHGRSCLILASITPYTEHDSAVEECDAILEILLKTDAIEHLDTPQSHQTDSDTELRDFTLAGRQGWPLADATENLRTNGVKILLEAGADPNLKTDSGVTALHAACRWFLPDVVDIVRLLVRYGADVNAVSDQGWSPLGYAASRGSCVEISKILVEAGAHIESMACDSTALQSAARYDISGGEVMRYLISKGADVNATGGEFGSVLLAILERPCSFFLDDDGSSRTERDPQPQILEFLLELLEHELNLNLVPDGWLSSLETAARNNLPIVVSFLLEHGVELPKFKGKGKHPSRNMDEHETLCVLRTIPQTSILSHVNPSHHQIFSILLDSGAQPDVDQAGFVEMTVLGAACTSTRDDYLQTATLLLEHGANPNLRDMKGHLPIQRAAYAVSLGHLQKLVEHGASVQADDKEYGSLLHSLCKGYAKQIPVIRKSEVFFSCFRFLKERLLRGSLWTQDGAGRNCLHYLTELSEEARLVLHVNKTFSVCNSDAVPILQAYITIDDHLHPLERTSGPTLAVFLSQDSDGLSVFHIAAQKGDLHVMQMFVEFIASQEAWHAENGLSEEMITLAFMTQPDKRGWTALHHAASNGRAFACKFILEATKSGVVGILTSNGESAQDLANKNHYYGISEYITQFKDGMPEDEKAKRKADTILISIVSKLISLEATEDQLLEVIREQSDRLTSIQDR